MSQAIQDSAEKPGPQREKMKEWWSGK